MDQLRDNEILHKNVRYSVWMQNKGKGEMAHIRKHDDNSTIAGTMFGKMSNFKNDVMPWAKRFIEKNF